MRLIDADAIVYTHAIARSIDDGHNWNELCVTKDEIDDMPSANPELKKGQWIEYPDCLRYEGAYNDDHIICSECGHVFSICDNCTEEFDFCPHCGAEMARGEL